MVASGELLDGGVIMCNHAHKDRDSVPKPLAREGTGFKLFTVDKFREGSNLKPLANQWRYTCDPREGILWEDETARDIGFCFFPDFATARAARTLWVDAVHTSKSSVAIYEIYYAEGCGSSWLEEKLVTGAALRMSVCKYFRAVREILI